MTAIRTLDPRWLAQREALQDRYAEVSRLPDASRLAFLHGAETEWNDAEVAQMWATSLQNPVSDEETHNNLYIHVPFCKSICSFCNYDRLQPSSPRLLERWLERVLHSVSIIAPAVAPMSFHTLYLGGGTPSVLPAQMLSTLLETIDEAFTWHPYAGRQFEFDPAVINRERLEVLAKHGFEHLSFGVETLDPAVNAAHNRGAQDIELVAKRFRDCEEVGIHDVACDFLLGLAGTTPDIMLREMETVLTRFRPTWIDIFMITPTLDYVNTHFEGSYEAFWTHLKPFQDTIPAALPDLAERTGYRVHGGQGHHMMVFRKDRPRLRSKFSYTALTSEAKRPVNLLGLGRSARSQIFGHAAFHARDPQDDPSVAGPGSYVGHVFGVEGEVRTFLSHILRDEDVIDRADFARIFGADVTERIPVALAGWQHDGVARLDDDAVRFEPQSRQQRTRSLLWLVPDEPLEYEIARRQKLDLGPEGIADLCLPLPPGVPIALAHVYEGLEGTRLVVRTPSGERVKLRVAPRLTPGATLRLVLEQPPRRSDLAALQKVIGKLRRLLQARHNSICDDLESGEDD